MATGDRARGLRLGHLVSSGAAELRAAGVDLPRLEAELLLAAALGCTRERILAHPEQPAGARAAGAYRRLVLRRAGREPLAYLVGRREFMSLDLEVTREVLVPRPDSELLAEQALAWLRAWPGGNAAAAAPARPPVVVDVGTGCGALALAVAHGAPAAQVWALDLSPAAASLAARNAARLGLAGRVRFLVSDLLAGLTGPDAPPDFDRADLIIANLPYVPSGIIDSLAPEVAMHEPRLALDGGADGLDLIRRLVPQAAAALRPGGALGLECDPDQAGAVVEMLGAAGFTGAQVRCDLAGRERTVWAGAPGAPAGAPPGAGEVEAP